jgi:hypothetical protein
MVGQKKMKIISVKAELRETTSNKGTTQQTKNPDELSDIFQEYRAVSDQFFDG